VRRQAQSRRDHEAIEDAECELNEQGERRGGNRTL
jgi:hypothetical protein